MINLLDNLNVETISYMFDQTMEDFLQIDDRIFISSRGTYINRGLIDHVDHNKAKNALLEISLKLQLGSELGTDIKPFIVFLLIVIIFQLRIQMKITYFYILIL